MPLLYSWVPPLSCARQASEALSSAPCVNSLSRHRVLDHRMTYEDSVGWGDASKDTPTLTLMETRTHSFPDVRAASSGKGKMSRGTERPPLSETKLRANHSSVL